MSRRRSILIIALAFAALVAVVVVSEIAYARSVVPPRGAATLAAFLDERPDVGSIRRFTHDRRFHIEIVGKRPDFEFAFPSSPPAYVFDQTGALVDWCGDPGDNPAYSRKWRVGTPENITPGNARRLVGAAEGKLREDR